MKTFKLFLGALMAINVLAFWRMPCLSRTGIARIDPLVSNGTLAEHAHAIHGSSGFSTSASYQDLIGGSCTSCEVVQDKSVYWHPALYFQDDSTGEFTLVNQVGGMLAYYLLYPNPGESTLKAFPAGFEMIAGDTNQRNFSYPVPDIEKSLWTGEFAQQTFLRQAALGFNCLNYAKTPEGSLYRHFMPEKSYMDANCIDGVRFELMFPSCWNGKDRTSKDKKSHVAYPSQVMTGTCPEDFPVRLPSLFYETIWDTHAFSGKSGKFVLSNGDPTGCGYHGDFMMGWDEGFLQQAVDTCTNLSGKIEDCPLFTIQGTDKYSNCELELSGVLAKENVKADLSSLPGNVVIQYGSAYAHGATAGGSQAATAGGTLGSAAPVATLSYSAGISLATSDTYVPGAIFAISQTSSAPATVSSAEVVNAAEVAPTTPSPIAAATTPRPSFFSTQYTTLGANTVEEILWVEEVVTVTAEETATVLVPGRKRHLHARRHGGQ